LPGRIGPGDEGVSVKEISIGEFARRSRLSLKALRLYDERGVLVPARVDQASGYRYYDTAQVDQARLVVMLRQLQFPLAAIKKLLACDPADAAARIAEHWRDAEAAHDARRELADYLVNQLSGKRSVMYEFSIYWGEVSADSDGPMEMCKPVPETQAHALAERYPALTLRTEPGHREMFVAVPAGPGGISPVHFELAMESMRAWAHEQGYEDEHPNLWPDLGLRITYFSTGPVTDPVPDYDVAVAFA
jgi:DNA-binding transcriptional MerR regulator